MMKEQNYVLCLAIIALLAGCNSGTASSSRETEISMTASQEITNAAQRETAPPAVISEIDSVLVTANSTEKTASKDWMFGEGRHLTEEELTDIQNFINGESGHKYKNYGFLLSGYESTEYVNLTHVLYSGAGIPRDEVTEEEINNFYERNKIEDHVDILKFTTGQINQYLEQTAGIGLQDHKGSFGFSYFPEFDSYYWGATDTNMCNFICVDGTFANDVYKVYCSPGEYGTFIDGCIVTLRKAENGYQFVSNQLIITKDNTNHSAAQYNNMLLGQGGLYESRYQKEEIDFNNNIFKTNKQVFTRNELLQMNPELLEIFRNEIYARHGCFFEDPGLNEFFQQFSWYEGNKAVTDFDESVFNEYEKANCELVRSVEIWNQ